MLRGRDDTLGSKKAAESFGCESPLVVLMHN